MDHFWGISRAFVFRGSENQTTMGLEGAFVQAEPRTMLLYEVKVPDLFV